MNHNESKYSKIHLTVQAEVPTPPPPPGFTSPFKSIKEWLIHLDDTNNYKGTISEYHFSLIESPSNNLLSLEGFNTYNIAENVIERRIDFKPATHLFFALPKEEFGNLSQQQLREQVLDKILEFTKSEKFDNSFLSKGKSIKIGFKGEIWSR